MELEESQITVGYPSADFPGRPSFQFDIPTDWRAVPSTRADAVVAGPTEIHGVRPNVVVTSHPVEPGPPTAKLRYIVDRELERLGGRVVDQPVESSDGRTLSIRFVHRVDNSGVEIEQRLTLRYIDGSPIAHVLAATGTYAPSSEEARAMVDAVVSSIAYGAA